MSKKLRKIFNKKNIFIFILGGLVFGTIGVSASTLLYSKDVTYDNSSSGLGSTNLQDALDELYEQAKNAGGASVSCDETGNCIVTCKQGDPTITGSGYSCTTTTATTVTCPSDKPNYVATSTGYWCVPESISIGGKSVDVVISGSGLYADSTEGGRYVYKGASPNNYITFNGETWRILVVEADGTLKIMKQDRIRVMPYDSNKSGAWSSATLNTYLNGTYYNSLSTTAKSYIQNHSFNVGDVGESSNLTTTISQEKAKTWTGNIALANVSDVIKSNTNTSSCGSISSNNSNYSTCKTSSFIVTTMASTEPWLLSLHSASSSVAWFATNGSDVYGYPGGVLADGAAYTHGVFPVLYLSSSITLTGSGTSSDPYQLS